MATYFVGRKGFLKNAFSLKEALAASVDGDVIELEENYHPVKEGKLNITKSITIEGTETESGANVLCPISISGGASVTLRNVLLVPDDAQKEIYIIYIAGDSKVSLDDVTVISGDIHDCNKYNVYAENSSLEMRGCNINVRMKINHSILNCQQSFIMYEEGNALYAYKGSKLTLKDTNLVGGYVSKEENRWFPCCKIQDSELSAANVGIHQPNYNYSQAFCLVNAKVSLEGGECDALFMTNSSLSVAAADIVQSCFIQKHSIVKAGSLFIHGIGNNVNLYMSDHSELEAKFIAFGKLTNPNIKMEKNCSFSCNVIGKAKYNEQEERFLMDAEGRLFYAGEAPPIQYFGEASAFQKLNEMVGIASVKESVKEFIAIAELNQRRKASGIKTSVFSLHSIFRGNPGTGKTTVARLIGQILYEKGIIRSNTLVEASRSDLVSTFFGATAGKTREVLESALGGVLFIDEAYTLSEGGSQAAFGGPVNYGKEAIDEILKFMEDHREDIVIIFAGYTDKMKEFLKMNEGLKSRIPNTFTFENYTEEELIEIGFEDLQRQSYKMDREIYADLVRRQYAKSNDNSNGRWVRNLNERLIRKMALRLARDKEADLTRITQEDVDSVDSI